MFIGGTSRNIPYWGKVARGKLTPGESCPRVKVARKILLKKLAWGKVAPPPTKIYFFLFKITIFF